MREARLVMADLAVSGLTPEQMVLVMELSASLTVEARPVEDKSANKRRRRDREYQAERRRQNRQKSAESDDTPPNEDTSNPPSEPEGSSGKTPAKKSTKTFLPDDWTPPPVAELTPKARACAEQWTRENYETVAEAFALYWRREQKKTGDWRLTWCGWIIREHSKVMRDQKFGNGAPAEKKHDDRPLTTDELRRAIQFNEDQGNKEKAAAYRFQLQARTALSAGTRQ